MAQLENEASIDDRIALKKRARRRLVGAVALVLLAAVVLPMVVDLEPRPPTQEMEVRIPSQDADSVTHFLPNRATPTPLPPMPDSAATEKISEPPPVEAKPIAKPVEKPAAAKPAEKTVSKADEARARAALAGKEIEDDWLILIAAYKDEVNVKRVTDKLKQIDVPALTERFESPQGPRTRVRAGPFKSRQAAEQALVKMKKAGIDGSIAQSGK